MAEDEGKGQLMNCGRVPFPPRAASGRRTGKDEESKVWDAAGEKIILR